MSATGFDYVAMNREGKRCRGVVRATDRAEALRQVTAGGLTVLKIRAARVGAGRSKRIKLKELAQFTYQFSVLISARIQISEGLASIAAQETNPRLAEIVRDVAGRIQTGEQVAVALNAYRDDFGDVFVDTIRAAERTGNMTKALEHLSETLEKRDESAQQVKSALMYPMVVIGVLLLGVTFLVTFVIPKFAKMFKERGVDLPVLTRVLMAIGESAQSYWWAYLIVIGGAVYGARKFLRSARGRLAADRVLHRIPYLNRILIGLAISRFARVFGMSLTSGLGLIESLELSGRASGRAVLERDTKLMAEQVRAGGRLNQVLSKCGYFTPFTRRMLAAGEDAADLPRMCSVVARHYERETGYLTKNIATVIEPVMIVLIASAVLVVALAIFLPMWNMVSLVG